MKLKDNHEKESLEVVQKELKSKEIL